MNIQEFTNKIKYQLRCHIDTLNKAICSRKLKISGSYQLPKAIRIIETPTQFIAELVGVQIPTARQIYQLEAFEPEYFNSAADYFCPGFTVSDGIPGTIVDAHHNGIADMGFITQYDHTIFQNKLRLNPPLTQISSPNANIPLWVGPNADATILHNIAVIRTENQRVLYRFISSAVIFQKKHSIDFVSMEFYKLLQIRPISGGVTDSSQSPASLARQIHSFADQPIKEKLWDAFLQQHADDFAYALDNSSARSQVRLEWQVKADPKLTLSIPDFMMERKDGYFDILDLKQGLRKSKLTRGTPARPMYKYDVEEAISQLQTYAEYFRYEENRLWAEKHYGIRTSDIQIIGVIGNYDSIDPGIMERLKIRRPNLWLIDYNSLAHLIAAKFKIS